MDGDKHFSHEHPLRCFEDKQVGDDYEEDVKAYTCSICGLPILSVPSYTCSVDANCNFFLHKPCAQLPQRLLDHPIHKSTIPYTIHTLSLQPKLPRKNFIYQCDECKELEIHPLAVVPAEIKTKHISHQSHSLVAFSRETRCRCDGCGEVHEHEGFFFCCQECDFWIHQDCTLLPSVVKLPSHPHPFLLTYSLPSVVLYIETCNICERELHLRGRGVYFCGDCYSFAHPTCAKSRMKNLKTETRLGLIQLPDEGDAFPSLVIRRCMEANPLTQHDDDGDEKYHKHPLILDDGTSSRYRNLVCDVCIQPINISSPFYRCRQLQSDGCHFLAHDICADHMCKTKSLSLYRMGYSGHASIRPDLSNVVFNSVFFCLFCHRPCNGLCYSDANDYKNLLFFDPVCLLLPNTIRHASHSQHVLFQTNRLQQPSSDTTTSTSTLLSCCSGECFRFDVYKCLHECDFYIHRRCALHPKMTHHKFDEHPLELIMSSNDDEKEYCCFCEFCEQDID